MQPGILPYKFLADYQNYPAGEIAGLQIAVGDRLAESKVKTKDGTGEPMVSMVCRRATAEDLAAYREKMKPRPRHRPRLVAIRFKTSVGRYRAGDIAGFVAHIARQYVEGYMKGGKNGTRVNSVADYYVDRIADDVTAPEPKPEKPRQEPVPRQKPKRRRQKASLDEKGATEKK